VAYRLAFSATSVVHPVFHVSQLKKLVSNSSVLTHFPDAAIEYQVPEGRNKEMLR
jgi:hypothetical protein